MRNLLHCFNLIMDTDLGKIEDPILSVSNTYVNKQNRSIHTDLENYIVESENNLDLLNGDEMQSDYFPSVPAHIFLSHSRKDETMAYSLKYYLEITFKVNVFVDSSVWGYCNDLLRQVDETYCQNIDGKSFNYDKRNNSTAAIHMMLSTALTEMMDKCECIIFLNSRRSNWQECYGKNVQTASPWIYHELSTMKVLRRRIPTGRKIYFTRSLTEDSKKGTIIYNISISKIPRISLKDFGTWVGQQEGKIFGTDFLDALYQRYDNVNL